MNYNFIEKTFSTNIFLKENIDNLPDWYILRAGEQTNGYGRFERIWQCDKNKDIAMSIIIPVSAKIREFAPNLTQIVGISVAEVLEEFLPVKNKHLLKIKWANDILIDERKICGILLESQSIGDKMKIVAGIGLNVNSHRLSRNINNNFKATSLFDETQKESNLDELSKKIISQIIDNIQKLESDGLSPFIEKLNEKLAFKGEIKTIIDGGKRISGIILGIGKNGELIMKTQNGEEKFISGEIGFEK